MLGADHLTENEVIIDYKLRRVSIKGNEIPFTLTKSVANTIVSTTCTTSVLKTVTIPGRTIQLIDVALPEVVKSRNPSSVLTDSLATAKLPQHLLVARTLSPVFNYCALLQIMNISPTSVTIYQGTKLGEVTPLADICLIETQHPPSPAAAIPVLPDIDLTESTISPTQKGKLLALLQQYNGLFATQDELLRRTSVVKHAIHTEGPPICQPVHRQPVAL